MVVEINDRFGSQAASQTISLEWLLSGAYQPLAIRFSHVAILSVYFHQKRTFRSSIY
jgi:hypothetical protein